MQNLIKIVTTSDDPCFAKYFSGPGIISFIFLGNLCKIVQANTSKLAISQEFYV